MILDQLTLHDFGVYGGRQSIDLTPVSQDKPIILFGGLNGGGKTTLLDALQLCFFGNVAQCAGRGDLPYDEYLRRSVHRGAVSPEAGVEVAFRHTVDGEVQHWRLTRTWSAADHVRERFQVFRDDRLDRTASEQWSAQVEDFIPSRIAPLFLFDGEKVEGYADLTQAPGLIRTAIQNLLGLDVVERLAADLLTIERKRRGDLAAPEEAKALALLREEIQKLVTERARHLRERAAAANELDRLRRTVTDLDQRYEREGGALFEDRGRLEAELAVTLRGQEAVRRSLRELAAGALPFRMVGAMLDTVYRQGIREEQTRLNQQTAEAIAAEHKAILALPAVRELSDVVRADIAEALNARATRFRHSGEQPRYLEMDDSARAAVDALINGDLGDLANQAGDLLRQERQLRDGIEHLRNLLGAVPSQDLVTDLIAQRETVWDQVRLAEFEQARREGDIARLDRDLETARDRETRLLEAAAREQFDREDVGRLLVHSAKVRATLNNFGTAVVARHVARIEQFVLDSFRQLVRKPTLVTDLKIDRETFTLELRGGNGHLLTAERLSAGERQLLAVAILWGLARASGRPLPTVIDTPLGRLDAEHRSRLVSRYFPHASHQVLLLSTDEEITRDHYHALRPAIGRSYRLRFDESEQRTVIEPGYFETSEAA